jgi:hypothetical protein
MSRSFVYGLRAVGRAHQIPEMEFVKIFVNGLKSDIFKDEMSSRVSESPNVVNECRNELLTYQN